MKDDGKGARPDGSFVCGGCGATFTETEFDAAWRKKVGVYPAFIGCPQCGWYKIVLLGPKLTDAGAVRQ